MPTDLHCHLLPGLDDGPATHADALALARAIVASGVDRVVATPHVNHRFPTRPEVIAAAVARLGDALRDEGIALEVLPGAEVAAGHLPDLDAGDLSALVLGRGPWLLLEPPTTAEFAYEQAVERVLDAGLRPLVAHPERCRLFQAAPERLGGLVVRGARLSVTAASLTGHFGRPPQLLAWRLVEEGLVANVASDAHDLRGRPPRLLEDLAAAGLSDAATAWCETFPAGVLGERARDPAAPAAPAAEQPLDVASSMVEDGSAPEEVERYLLAHLPAPIVRRQLRRLLRQRHPS